MPLEPPDFKHLSAAQGFAALGMYEDANAELEEIDPFCRGLPEILQVRVAIYHGVEKWDLLQTVARMLADFEPDEPGWAIEIAYATRRTETLDAAKALLLEASERFPDFALIHYNLACYESQLGRLDSAKQYLKRAFQLKPDYRQMALDDPDLAPLWTAADS